MAHSLSIIKDISHLGVRLGLGLPGWLLGPVARAHTMPGMRRDEKEIVKRQNKVPPWNWYSYQGIFQQTCLRLVRCCPWLASSLRRWCPRGSVPWSPPKQPPERWFCCYRKSTMMEWRFTSKWTGVDKAILKVDQRLTMIGGQGWLAKDALVNKSWYISVTLFFLLITLQTSLAKSSFLIPCTLQQNFR